MSQPEYIKVNMFNYDEDQVDQLNEWGIWASQYIDHLELRLQRANDLLRRIEKSDRKMHWQPGETFGSALEKTREYLDELKLEKEIEEGMHLEDGK